MIPDLPRTAGFETQWRMVENKQMANGNQRRKGAFGLGLPEGVIHAEGLTIGLPDLCHAVGGKLHIGGVGGLKDCRKAAT